MASPSATDIVTLTAHCHCKSNVFSITVPESALPLCSPICQCATCRHVTGSSLHTTVIVPLSQCIALPVISATNLVQYKTSDNLTRQFCGTCGADVYYLAPNAWVLCTGVLDSIAPGQLSRSLIYVEDSGDGGAAAYLPTYKSYCGSSSGRDAHGPVTDIAMLGYKSQAKMKAKAGVPSRGKLQCRCHCGGVEFYISRKKPIDDVSETGLTVHKRRCTYCPCETCRRCSGFELTGWFGVPQDDIFWHDGSAIQFDKGTLKTYESTPGVVCREFCGVCGAKVFYRREAGVIDVMAGLVETDSRAEEWLKWEADDDFAQAALDLPFFREISDGIIKWNLDIQSG
ncbi:hypothetical protein DRE_02777 [Drechslerella stenobrocha 248]|uniref:CENP-V/GFA domain-containing protein n=1 Tax=Drechslerella stenobrocha 248 TaxID=1043628 RepID=W7IFG7_9PEZI|nr:hypothetical protein DRE_02777 [Drechslerella stenobrocha 248]